MCELTDKAPTEKHIKDVLSGDIEAYRHIISQYQQSIWRIMAFALCDRDTTEDLVQQTFVNAYYQLKTFETGKGRDFGAWLRTIARNLLRQELRRLSRQDRKFKGYRSRLLERLHSDKADDLSSEAERALLAACKNTLSPHAREALALRYEKAMDFSRIAQAMQRTVAASRQLLQRARQHLRECMEKGGASS